MALFTKDCLTARDVAKIFFTTASPSSCQVRNVESQFVSGRLKGKRVSVGLSTSWITTSVNVAEYMASQSYRKQLAAHGAKLVATKSDLGQSYRNLLIDYFQAVVLRRKSQWRSKHVWFKHSVIAGQMMLIAAVLVVAVLSVGVFGPSDFPEHTVIKHWIGQQVDHYKIIRWHPACNTEEDHTVAIRVEYRYSQNNRRGVKTDRTFLVRDNNILSVGSSDNVED